MRSAAWLAVWICGAAAAGDAKFDEKPKGERRFDIIQYFAQHGREVSFGGDSLVWTGPGDCSQDEGMFPILSLQGDGVRIRNARIVGAPDGIHVSGKDCVIENVIFPKVCEDAITANGADNLVIRNCWFRGARDKAIQINAGKNVLIENCVFEDCAKPIRVKAGATVTVRGNRSSGSVVFVMADGEGAEADVTANDVERSKWFLKAENGAVIRASENRTRRIERKNDEKSGGEIRAR